MTSRETQGSEPFHLELAKVIDATKSDGVVPWQIDRAGSHWTSWYHFSILQKLPT